MKNESHWSVSAVESIFNLKNALLVKYVFGYEIYPLLIGNWKLIFERNDCLIRVLISGSVYFVVIALSIVQKIISQ